MPNAVPFCEGWCDIVVTAASQAQAGYLETGSIGVGLRSGVLAGGEAFAFSAVGGAFNSAYGADLSSGELLGRSVVEGLVGGAFSSAGGGRFSDGFLGAFVGSESSGLIGEIGGNQNEVSYYSASNRALRVMVAAVTGGTASQLAGGNFSTGALAAAFQQLFNDQTDLDRLRAEEAAYGEFRNFARMNTGASPMGLADAVASAAAVCARNGGGCTYVNGSDATGWNKQAWNNIVAATGGRDISGGGNIMCVINTTACTQVTHAYTYINGRRVLAIRPTPLTVTGTVIIPNAAPGILTLYFYNRPYNGWLSAKDLSGPPRP